ncbi:MAG: universal stress protein [Sphingobacteriaceae bacterium]|jgi:nucleotide-binding universal stress UspA family protein
MINFKVKKIMVPYDFSANAEKAISHAAFIASIQKAVLYLVHVINKSELVDIILPILKLKSNKVVIDLVNQRLDDVCVKIRKDYGVMPKPIVSTGNITSEIVNLAEENNVDLIIMGTQGKDSKSDLFLGSTAYRLVTKSPYPVMTIKDAVNKKGYKNILLPIDLSEHSRQKVNYAIGMAKAFSAKVTVLGLYDEKEKDDKFKLEIVCKQIEKLCEKSKVTYEVFIDKTKHRVSKTTSFAKKHKNDVIITMTDQKADGARGILSSYDHELVHTSKIPVISIEPETSGISSGSTAGIPF